MSVTDTAGIAEVSDGVHTYQVEINPFRDREKAFAVSDSAGSVTEEYAWLGACVHSRFADVFITLQKSINTCNVFFGANILEEITGSVECTEVNGRYTASNVFTYEGKEYIACVEKDFSREIPSYTYTVSGKDLRDLEGYQALYQAIDSEFYPILADLDKALEDYIEGRQRGKEAEA